MTSSKILLLLLSATPWISIGCGTTTSKRLGLAPPKTVERVDLGRYLGKWYEIAAFPQRFQRGCTATTATYSRRGDGDIAVVNRCRKDALDGPWKTAVGRARVVDKQTNAKLEVSFFRPFWGDYWIVDLSPRYDYAVVGHPSRDYLWILSRHPTLAPDVYSGILRRLRAAGFPLERLRKTLQAAPRSLAGSRPVDAPRVGG